MSSNIRKKYSAPKFGGVVLYDIGMRPSQSGGGDSGDVPGRPLRINSVDSVVLPVTDEVIPSDLIKDVYTESEVLPDTAAPAAPETPAE